MTDLRVIGTLQIKTQPNITSVGILDNLMVNGNATFSNLFALNLQNSSLTLNSIESMPLKIGKFAGIENQLENSIAIGTEAGKINQQTNSIAIGTLAGQINQNNFSIAIGNRVGQTNQGSYSIGIGNLAGNNNQQNNSIVLNASTTTLTGNLSYSTFISPIRSITQTNLMSYNSSTFELSYFPSATLYMTMKFESYQIFIGNNFSVSNNLDTIVKWTGSSVGSINGLTYDSSSGILTINEFGTYYFYVSLNWNSPNSGLKTLYLPNSFDSGDTITTSNFNTQYPILAQQHFISTFQLFSFSYSLNISSSDLPFTFCVGFKQTTGSSSNLVGTTSAASNPSNLKILRIFY
jgi:hypothetical protein